MKKNEEIENKIKAILETIRPYLNADGGDIEYIKYENDYLYIKLLGVCGNCSFADDTIQNGIYETIKQSVPSIKGVINSQF